MFSLSFIEGYKNIMMTNDVIFKPLSLLSFLSWYVTLINQQMMQQNK